VSSDSRLPDYELVDLRIITSTPGLKAAFHPLRDQLLDLLLERAATVAELAQAVGRPKSSVAYHVNVLVDAGLLKVVRTRRVRAIEERFFGRTARIFYVGQIQPDQLSAIPNILVDAAAESVPAPEADDVRAIVRHARISRKDAAAFWDRLFAVTREFSALPRSGDETFRVGGGPLPDRVPEPA
jgi:DNA-binding transcriptional ArsR family regulator